MNYIIITHKLNKKTAQATAIVVSYNYIIDRKVAIPLEIRTKIQQLEKNIF
jgi:hypothetical protein